MHERNTKHECVAITQSKFGVRFLCLGTTVNYSIHLLMLALSLLIVDSTLPNLLT